VFYIESWGEELPEHNIGRDEAPLCSGSRRTEYLPASNEAMTAQMEWASGRLPERPAAKPTRREAGKVVAARKSDEKRLQNRAMKAAADLQSLIDEGLSLQQQRIDSEPEKAIALLAEHEAVLRKERQARTDMVKARKDLDAFLGKGEKD
jgi:hypothetical protein